MSTLGFMHIEQLLRNNKVHNVLYFLGYVLINHTKKYQEYIYLYSQYHLIINISFLVRIYFPVGYHLRKILSGVNVARNPVIN